MSTGYHHHIIRFDPSSSPIAAHDAGTIHTKFYTGGLWEKRFNILSVKASLRGLQTEIPATTCQFGLFLSRRELGDKVSSNFSAWNMAVDSSYPNSSQMGISDIFYHHFFGGGLPENAPQYLFAPELEVDYFSPLCASLVFENYDAVLTYSGVIRCHLTFGIEYL